MLLCVYFLSELLMWDAFCLHLWCNINTLIGIFLTLRWYQIREREDDEIIEALNRYTLKLQTSLKVVNSTDM
jgi:hypothetical protein